MKRTHERYAALYGVFESLSLRQTIRLRAGLNRRGPQPVAPLRSRRGGQPCGSSFRSRNEAATGPRLSGGRRSLFDRAGRGASACVQRRDRRLSATVLESSRRVLLIPFAPMIVGLGSLGVDCLGTFATAGWTGLNLSPNWVCLPAIALTGAFQAMLMAAMLRRGAPMMPRCPDAFGGLAAEGLVEFWLRLFQAQDAGIMKLV